VTAPHPYELLAELLEYPEPDLLDAAERCQRALAGRGPEVAALLTRFAAAVAGKDGDELEELYARTFDLNPARCLDLGYQVFGETYRRGSFLVKMKGATSRHGVDPGVELADHLPIVLRLIPRLSPEDEPRDLVSEVVVPALNKVLSSFEDEGGGYRMLLEATLRVLMIDFGVEHVASLPAGLDGGGSGGRHLPVFPGFNPPSERRAS
jgi:nitrate reductase delta subunit